MIIKSAFRTLGMRAGLVEDDGQEVREVAPDISSDLPPELMAMEAQRLGLDPWKDRNRVLQSIQDAMRDRGS